MSESQTILRTEPAPADSLKNPTFIIAMALLFTAQMTIVLVYWRGTQEVQNVISSSVISLIIGGLVGFYFGKSKPEAPHPDAAPLIGGVPIPGTVVTTETPATTTTIKTEAGPTPTQEPVEPKPERTEP